MSKINLLVGMTKDQVLSLAKNLGESAKTKVINFFNNDEDGKITHVNELAILNSVFDGTGKVKMPKDNTQVVNMKGHTISDCSVKKSDGATSYSILYDEDGDGYADGHNMGKYQVLNCSNGNFESKGYHAKDKNLDGIADTKESFHVKQEGEVLRDIATNENYFGNGLIQIIK